MKPAALLPTALLTACLATSPATRKEIPHGAHYVATGSSFAAGAGIAPSKSGPARCDRSARNYATLLAARLGLSLDDQTCGGAKTTHLLGAWNELPPQLDAVGPDTRLVTTTIGGNDVDYVANLIAGSCGADRTIVLGGSKIPCFSAPKPTEEQYMRLEANMREIARKVKERAPRSRMIFIQYMTMVPVRPCEAADLSPAAATAAREIGRRLAAITARAARLEGAEVIPVDQLSLGHGPCDVRPWSRGTKVTAGNGVVWHPSSLGHAEIAKLLEERLGH